MKVDNVIKRNLDGTEGAKLIVLAQVLILIAFVLGLQFVVSTTGGTLFLAAAVAPGIATLAILLAATVLLFRYRKAHSLFSIEVYQPGDIIFKEGDLPDCAYFIRKGEVEVLQREDGRDAVVAVLKDGEYFGEMALLSTNRRNATVRARTTTYVGLVGKENFLTMLSLVRSTQADVQKTVQRRARAAGGSSTG
jgi:Cyclic nucleotide-binding domain